MKQTPNKKSKYIQGVFNPLNPQKYKGSVPIVYRSRPEKKIMSWLDNNNQVVLWGSESVVIPYQSPVDNKIHRYFVDFVAQVKMPDGSIKKLLIEYKPESQSKPPVYSDRKKPSTMLYERYHWAVNQAKWAAATQYAKSKGYQFVVLNEKHLT